MENNTVFLIRRSPGGITAVSRDAPTKFFSSRRRTAAVVATGACAIVVALCLAGYWTSEASVHAQSAAWLRQQQLHAAPGPKMQEVSCLCAVCACRVRVALACRFQSLIIASACACARVYAGFRACGTHQPGFFWLESTKQSGPVLVVTPGHADSDRATDSASD